MQFSESNLSDLPDSVKRQLLQLAKAEADALEASISSPVAAFRAKYRDRPDLFAAECIEWKAGEGPAPYQLEILAELPKRKRVAVRGPHTLGKSAMSSWMTLWFFLTRDGVADWKIITTASAWRQLTLYLWPEVHKWAGRLRWDRIGREPLTEQELLQLMLKGRTGFAAAVASNDHQKIEGAHADSIMYVFDEAKAIPADIWDAAEGALMSGDAYAVAVSTPGEPAGRFYQIHKRDRGYEDWWVRHVTLAEMIAAGRMTQEKADDRARQWGQDSAVFQNRVLGQFAASDEDGVIPLAWIEAAVERWHEWKAAGRPGKVQVIGVDVGESKDRSVLALRAGNVIAELRKESGGDLMATTGRVAGLLQANDNALAVVDGIGIGAGVVSRLRELGLRVSAFIASAAASKRDRTGEFGFANMRAWAWWNLREMLDPASGLDVALPPDEDLTGELASPHWREVSGGRIELESKDKIRERLERSTDCADAVVQAFSVPTQHVWEYHKVEGRRSTQRERVWR